MKKKSLLAPSADKSPESDPRVIQRLLLNLVSHIPKSDVKESDKPDSRARAIATKAARNAAGVSGTLALPPGPLGMITILPDLMAVWSIQKQMVADIAAAYGKTAILTKEAMVFCLFRHGAAMLTRDLVVRVGERMMVRKVALRTMQAVLKKVGVQVTQKVIAKAITKYVPLVGAVAIGGYAYYDTSRVAATAIDFFRREIDIEDSTTEKQKLKRNAKATAKEKAGAKKSLTKNSPPTSPRKKGLGKSSRDSP